MWLLVAYPPLLVPLSLDRPDSCPLCGGHEAPYVHAHVNRALPGLVRSKNEHGKRLVTHYSTVRFRCRRCRKTFTPALPGWVDGSHLPQYIVSRIVVWYCLGATPATIATKLEDEGWAIGGATLFRVLEAPGAVEPGLHDLHQANRRRVRRGKQRGRRPRRSFDGTIELTCEERFNSLQVDVWEPDIPGSADFAVARFSVELFVLYGDALTRVTIAWLTRYLGTLDHAAAWDYPNWDHLEPTFTRGEDLAHSEAPDTLVVTATDLAQPPTPDSPLLRRAVGTALRTAALDRADWHQVAKRKRAWANRSDGLLIAEMAEDQLFDRI